MDEARTQWPLILNAIRLLPTALRKPTYKFIKVLSKIILILNQISSKLVYPFNRNEVTNMQTHKLLPV